MGGWGVEGGIGGWEDDIWLATDIWFCKCWGVVAVLWGVVGPKVKLKSEECQGLLFYRCLRLELFPLSCLISEFCVWLPFYFVNYDDIIGGWGWLWNSIVEFNLLHVSIWSWTDFNRLPRAWPYYYCQSWSETKRIEKKVSYFTCGGSNEKDCLFQNEIVLAFLILNYFCFPPNVTWNHSSTMGILHEGFKVPKVSMSFPKLNLPSLLHQDVALVHGGTSVFSFIHS